MNQKVNKKKESNYKKVISILLPITSILFVLSFVLFKPSITGFTTAEQQGDFRMIDADVVFTIHENEIVPVDSLIRVSVDATSRTIPLKEFISMTGQDAIITDGTIEKIGYEGQGYSQGTFLITLKEMGFLDPIKKGDHVLITEILYEEAILFRKEQNIYID